MVRTIGLRGIPKDDDALRERQRVEQKRDTQIWRTFKQLYRRCEEHPPLEANSEYVVKALKNAVLGKD